jgi:hypothetical protein
MTELSPQAQAVLYGFRAVPNLMDGPSIAGALRAAAKQSIFADVAINKTIEVVPVDILLAIAVELEGVTSR